MRQTKAQEEASAMLAVWLEESSKAWELRQSGKSLRTIGRLLGFSHEKVRELLAEVYARRSDELDKSVTEHKLRQFDVLDYVIDEASEAWEQSKQPAEVHKSDTNIKRLGKGSENGADGEGEDEYDPDDIPGGLYLDENGEEVPAEERARRLREAAHNEFRLKLEKSVDGEMTIIEARTQETTETRYQTGNPAHLANVITAPKAQRDLLGLEPKGDGPAATFVVKVYGGGQNLEEVV